MNIRKIEVANFKSFENLDIELDKFNVLIGANAIGKVQLCFYISIFERYSKFWFRQCDIHAGGC